MSQFPDRTTIQTIDGVEVMVYSNKQHTELMKRINSVPKEYVHVKVVKQLSDGQIICHMFYEDEGKIRGYVDIIGVRGGCKQEVGYFAYFDVDNNKYYLSKQI